MANALAFISATGLDGIVKLRELAVTIIIASVNLNLVQPHITPGLLYLGIVMIGHFTQAVPFISSSLIFTLPPHLSSHIYWTSLDCLLYHLLNWRIIQTPKERVKETLWALETTKII